MEKIKEVVIVEGKYDKIRLSGIIDALIIETDGFGIFSDKEKMILIRNLAKKRGILILTDSDEAGFRIRNYISGNVSPELIKHAYIPDISGKEKRKEKPSKEGKIGVEGVDKEIILDAFKKAGISFNNEPQKNSKKITKTDFYTHGLSGGAGSNDLRKKLIKILNLPNRLSANKLLDVLNAFLTYEEYVGLINDLQTTND